MKTCWVGRVVLLGALAGCSVPESGPSAHSDNGQASGPSGAPVERQAMRPVVPEQLRSEPPSKAAERAEEPPAGEKRPDHDRGAANVPPQLSPPASANGPEGGEAPSNVAGINFANSLSEVFHDSASRVLPAVVTIQTAQAAEDEEMDPFLREFFGDRGGQRPQQSLGSGVIIDPSGINTAISSRSGGYEGIGFAIPVNLAKWVSRQLIEHGQVRWAYLGVGVQTITPQLAERAGLAGAEGLLVREVRPDSPAAKAGVRRGDLIRRFDDKQVTQPRQLQSAVERSEIGSQHHLEIVRNGKPSSLAITIQQQPPESTAARDARPRPADRPRR